MGRHYISSRSRCSEVLKERGIDGHLLDGIFITFSVPPPNNDAN